MPSPANIHWSTTFDASSNGQTVKESLTLFMLDWRFPALTYARHQSASMADAAPRFQNFALRFVAGEIVATPADDRPGLRKILLAALSTHDWQSNLTNANRPSKDLVPLSAHELVDAEERMRKSQLAGDSAESAFQRSWAWTIQNFALDRLRKEFRCDGRAEVFAAIDDYLLAAESETPWAELAEPLHMSIKALKTTSTRMRQRFQTLLEREVARTVASQAAAAVEFQILFSTDEQGS